MVEPEWVLGHNTEAAKCSLPDIRPGILFYVTESIVGKGNVNPFDMSLMTYKTFLREKNICILTLVGKASAQWASPKNWKYTE